MALETINQWAARISDTYIKDPVLGTPLGTYECTYLWRDFLMRVIGAPWDAGVAADTDGGGAWAYELWTQFGLQGNNDNRSAPSWLERVPRAEGGQRGDAIIWNRNTGWTGEAGHVAILDVDNGDTLTAWSQNAQPFGSPAKRITITGIGATGILGFLRPKKLITEPQEEDPMYQIIENDGKHYFCSGAGVALIESLTHRQNLEQALLVMKIRDSIKPEGGMGQTARETLTYYTAKARA